MRALGGIFDTDILSSKLDNLKSLTEKNKDQSNLNFKEAMSVMDKLVVKGLIHKNKAANQKARISKHLKSLNK